MITNINTFPNFCFLPQDMQMSILAEASPSELCKIALASKHLYQLTSEISKKKMILLVGQEQADPFFKTFKTWQATYSNFVQMSRIGRVVSPKEIDLDREYWAGEFLNGKLNGKGEKNFSNGSLEKGIFKDNVLHGEGRRITVDGTTEIGNFKNGFLDGPGTVLYNRGNKIIANFEEGRPQGFGKWILSTGEIIEGQFTDSANERFTLLTDSNGKIKIIKLH